MKRKKIKFDYQVTLIFDPRDNIYVAAVPELANCHSHGENPIEALENVYEAIELWLQTAREKKIPIPRPKIKRDFSGKFLLRTPLQLHETLALKAVINGKSMNEYVVGLLQNAV